MAFAHFLDNITDPCFKGESFTFDETSKGRSFAADPCLRLVPVMIKLGQLLFLIIFDTIGRIMVSPPHTHTHSPKSAINHKQ